MAKRCVYGPVPSRRLGLSLGVDLIPNKVCCYDCSYCQVGPTTALTVERASFLDPDEVARQVEAALCERPGAEIVTLSGSGEPTLYRDLEALVAALRRVTRLPLALLTNGGLLWRDEVLRAALAFDLCAPSLDAADPATFVEINRPHPSIDHATMLGGLRRFCRAFKGSCRLEIMLVRGVNDSPASLAALASLSDSLGVTAVDLNTVVRPPAHDAASVDEITLEQALATVARGCRAPVSVIAPFRGKAKRGDEERAPASEGAPTNDRRRLLLETVARRPCTVDDLAAVLTLDPSLVLQLCNDAETRGELVAVDQAGKRYYRAT